MYTIFTEKMGIKKNSYIRVKRKLKDTLLIINFKIRIKTTKSHNPVTTQSLRNTMFKIQTFFCYQEMNWNIKSE